MKKILVSVVLPILACYGCLSENQSKEAQAYDSISKELKAKYAPDSRSNVLEVTLDKVGDSYVLKGVTNNQQAKQEYVKAFEQQGIKVLDSIAVLPDTSLNGKIYGVTCQSVINFRTSGKYSAESATQAIMGTPVKVLEKKGGWIRAITPEGYIAWVSSPSIAQMDAQEYENYKNAKKVIVTTKYTTIYREASNKSLMVSDAVWGNVLLDLGSKGAWQKVSIADGREGFIPKADVEDFAKWLDSRNPCADNIIATAKQFIGIPYMWGGTSIKAVDCSGFTKTVYYLNGVILARDASQQCYTGDDVDIAEYVNGTQTLDAIKNLKKGDLIFFGSKATAEKKERITHVGIYVGEGIFIHSAGKVRINSLIPSDSNYYDGSTRLVRAQRMIGNVDSNKGIVSIKSIY